MIKDILPQSHTRELRECIYTMHCFMLASVRPKHPEQMPAHNITMKSDKGKRTQSYRPHYLKSIVSHKLSVSVEYSNTIQITSARTASTRSQLTILEWDWDETRRGEMRRDEARKAWMTDGIEKMAGIWRAVEIWRTVEIWGMAEIWRMVEIRRAHKRQQQCRVHLIVMERSK